MLAEAQEVLKRVAQNTEPASRVQMGCDHQQQKTGLQAGITMVMIQVFLPPKSDHTELRTGYGP